MKVDSSKRGTPWMPCVAMLILSSFAPVIYAQTTTTYSYDNLKHLVGATSSSGSGFQYQYDANGNLTNVTSSAPNAIAFATPVDVELSRPGQSASLTFTATAGQSYTLNANSISAMPSMGSLTISVYNAAGTLVGSELAGSTASISLPNLPAFGRYRTANGQHGKLGTDGQCDSNRLDRDNRRSNSDVGLCRLGSRSNHDWSAKRSLQVRESGRDTATARLPRRIDPRHSGKYWHENETPKRV